MNKKYQTCSKYCASFGRYSEGAWEEWHDSCVVKRTETCYHRYWSYTSDAICQCGDAYRIWTTNRPQSTVCTDLGKQWKGELSYNNQNTYLKVQWRNIVRDQNCVHSMSFFVDGVEQKDLWNRNKESVLINNNALFSLKVKVSIKKNPRHNFCYLNWNCECIEATVKIHLPERGAALRSAISNGNTNNKDNTETILGNKNVAVAGACVGGICL